MPIKTRKRFALRVFFTIASSVVVSIAVFLAGMTFWLRLAMKTSLPQLDGQIHVQGLTSSVTVRRDHHGVPHIDAASLDDLIEAQGYVTAQDRLWEMDMARRSAAGELAELLGPALIEHDRLQRILAMRPTAERMVMMLSPRDRRHLDDYARGVNAFIQGHSDHLPAEMRLLMYRPKPWQPADSILIGLSMAQMLDQHWPDKLGREKITHRIGAVLANDLYPTGSWRDDPPTASSTDRDEQRGNASGVSSTLPQTATLDDLLNLDELTNGRHNGCPSCNPGSNGWVISGARSASGKPILANDMHLTHQIPDIWYEADLKSGTFHAAGLSIPGIPFIVVGHNEQIAWGFTALYGDTQDIYIEQINGQGQSRTPSGWAPITHRREVIRVRGGHDVVVDAEHTWRGPVISSLLPHETRTLSLEWAAYDSHSVGIPLFDLDSAQNWQELRSALKQWWAPTLNVMYADRAGHIGYQAAGNIPNRPSGIVGVPIADFDHEWQGFIPFDRLPAVLDPPGGVLATANSRITPDGYPFQLTLEWASPYRVNRIRSWLDNKRKLTQEDMLALQNDIYSDVDKELAQRLATAIDHTSSADARLRQAAKLLHSWDGVIAVDSPAAAIVAAARTEFWTTIVQPRLGDDLKLYRWAESSFVQQEIAIREPLPWLPKEFHNWDECLAALVDRGLKDQAAPSDLFKWRYGDRHQVEIEHPLYGLVPWMKNWTGTGSHPQSGNGNTVKQVSKTFGPSQRFSIDWNNVDQATENIVVGQSGNPLSPWYLDQWPYWYSGTTFSLPFTQDAVEASTADTLQLIP